jgi:hypothetical protein
MSSEEWALARNKMLANRTNLITTDFPDEKINPISPFGLPKGNKSEITE